MTKIIGAKSGGGKQRKPVIAPDSLQSKVYIAMLYGLGEGEIEGFATSDEQSIYLDDTPLKNASGEWNFQNVTVDFRHGTNDQTYIEGFPDVASEVAVNVELKHSTPWIKSFNNLDLDAVRVRLKWGALKQQNVDNGDVSGVRIQYAIDLKIDNLAWQEVLNTEINAKTSTNYERSHRIDLPTAQRGWQIRVRRITPNSTSEYVSDKMYISAVTEVVDLKLRYPNTALLGLQYDAEHFSNVAKMSARLKGLKIKVPSNYDPETRQYHGFWDGTFKRAYSNNPAWIYYDICTADRYGLGERLKPFMVDKWSLYRLAQYCDEMVSDGNGGLEPRFTLNVYLQSADDAFAILSKMSGVFRAISYWNGQQIVCDADMPQDSMYSFSRANVIDGQFEYTGTRARDRHTVAKVAWDNKDNRFKTEYEFVRDEQAISKLGIKFVDIQAWGCTSKGQAQRAGWWALKSEQLETRMVSFKVGLDGYIPQPGKVIEISDELFAGRANGGRVSAINARKNIISLDRAITAKAGDKLIINSENGTAETRIIQTVQNHQVTVTQPFDNIAVENVWVLDSADLATMKFRVLSITQDEKHQFKITAVQYAPSKYDAIDTGAYIDERPISVINPKIQAPVTEVNIETEYRTVQSLNVATMIIHYPQVSGAVKYQVEWRKDNGNWIKLPITGANSVEIEGVYAGQYEARVTAISAFDVHSLATHSTLTAVQGKAGRPPKLANLTATGTLFGMRLDWAFSAKSEDTNYTEIQVSPDGRSNIATLGQFAYPTTTHQIQGLQGNLTQFYRAKIVDKLGNESDWTEWTSGTTSADPEMVLDILEGQINESTLDNILTGKINTAVTTVTANTQAILAETQARTQAVTAEAQARATAISNEAKARTAEITQRVTALNSEIGTTLAGLQNGLTQETQQRKDADSQTLSVLNAYKVSNDNAVSAILAKADNAISVNNAQASQINALQSSVTTVQNGLSTKLDSSAISNYYTKAQADEKIQQVTTGKIDEFNAHLNIGGNNLIPESDKFRLGTSGNIANRQILNDGSLKITGATNRFYNFISQQADLALRNIHFKTGDSFIVSIWLKAINPSQPPTEMPELYLSIDNTYKSDFEKTGSFENGGEVRYSQIRIANANRHLATPYVPHIGFSANAVGGGVIITKWQIQHGTKATDWTPALADTQAKFDTHAQAISTINSNVSNLNNTLTSQSQQLTQLRNDLTLTNANVATKADTTALNTLDSRVTQTNDRITAESQKITTLQNSLNTVNGTLNGKADSSALSNLNTTVQNINGAVTTQANQITALQSGLDTVNQTLNNKVNASALSDYYTKAQADNVMSGKIDEFKTSLVIGGDNLVLNSDVYIISGNKNFNFVNNLADIKGKDVIVSLDVEYSNITRAGRIGFEPSVHYTDGSYTYLGCWEHIRVNDSGKKRIYFKHKIKDLDFNLGQIGMYIQASGDIRIGRPMLQIGTQATAWTPALSDVDGKINANTQAISTINSNVSNLNNTVTSQGQAITQLNNNLTAINANVSQKADSTALTALDNKVTQQGNNITSQANQITALQSGLNTANQNIATKLDSSAIVNYYTKAETDNAMSGRIDTFRASINTEIAKLQKALKVTELDLRHLDENTYYPVTFTGLSHVEPRLIRISRNLSQYPEKPTWARHNGGFSLLCEWVVNGSGWGVITVVRNITVFEFGWIANNLTQSPIIKIGQMTNSSQEHCFLRGGARYKLETHDSIVATIRTTTYTHWGQSVAPMSYDESLTPKSDKQAVEAQISEEHTARTTATTALTQQINTMNTTLNGQSTTISQQTQTINGISAVRAVTVDNNGVISGYGLMSELRNGRVTSQFGVNADTFYIGSPANGKKPFIFNSSPRVIDGVSYPAGAWINSAYIANATIKMAHIDKASIGSLSALSANIGTLTTKDSRGTFTYTGSKIELRDPQGRLLLEMGLL